MLCTVTATSLAIALLAPAGWFSSPQPAPVHHHHHHQQAHTSYAHAPAPNSYPVPPPAAHAAGHCKFCQPGGRIVAPGPGLGWGFPNGNPDGYGWVDYGDALPLGGDRTPDYFFPRHNAMLPQQMFFPTYYNPYIQRGQRYIPYVGGGGDHPMGGLPAGSSLSPPLSGPDRQFSGSPLTPPVFQGEVENPPPAAPEESTRR